MRKVIFSIIVTLCSLIGWSQNVTCFEAQVNFNSTDWYLVEYDTWNEVAQYNPLTNTICLPYGCFYLYGYFDPASVAAGLNITAQGEIINTEIQYTDSSGYTIAYFGWNAITGCTDSTACNYNPNATCSNFAECDYSCQGCTDPTANNFNAEASVDNGTCCYSDWLTMQSNDSLIYYVYNGMQQYIAYGDNFSGQSNGFCYSPGCYQIYVQAMDGNAASFEFVNQNNSIVLQGNLPQGWWDYFSLNNGGILGCTTPYACNYNANATCDDGSCDFYSCQGCTDPNASNFNPDATIDNGTCCFGNTLEVNTPNEVYWYFWNEASSFSGIGNQTFCVNPGCGTFYAYGNNNMPYDFTITYNDTELVLSGNSWDQTNEWDDVATVHTQISFGDLVTGCTLQNACNYDPLANCGDYSLCDFSCQGCTDSTAFNFNPDATVDNGTCCTSNYYEITAISQGGMVSWSAFDGYGIQVGSTDFSSETFGFCVPSTCVSIYASDLLGMPYSLEIKKNGTVVYSNSNITEYEFIWSDDNNQTLGCGDPSACNYDPNATCFVYNICDYSCLGCTDPTAINFNPEATVDNGTCCSAQNWNVIAANGPFYYVANTADYYQYSYGSFPETTGFCMNADCFQFTAYSLTGESLEINLSNDSLTNYSTITTNPYLGYSTAPIGLNQVPGCLDPFACNYNPDATCDAGNCMYYCGGCMDPSALNYDSNVIFDDGSCYYQVEMPIVGMQMIPDNENNQFYVMMNLSQLGNAYPFIVTNSINDDLKMMNEVGSEMMGPYPCGDSVQFEIHAMGYNMNTLMSSSVYKMSCDALSAESIDITGIMMFPNPAQNQVQISGLNDKDQIQVFDMQGKLVDSFQNVNTQQLVINTSKWANGLYNVRLIQNLKTTNYKLQIAH